MQEVEISDHVPPEPMLGDRYASTAENPFVTTDQEPISTFSIDADGASYANIRRFLLDDRTLPSPGAVRIEEMINYFDLGYAYEPSEHPLSLNGELATCPWNPAHRLLRVGIQGKPLNIEEVGGSNFVFLMDVSGSMAGEDRLPLLKAGFKKFVDRMDADDRVAIVVYAGNAGLLLESTPGTEKAKIKAAIDRLGAGGSTAGAEGIVTAYEIAGENFIPGGNNRIIIGTDGDFNVGPVNHDELIDLIEQKRESGIFLTVLGVGRGNYNDHMLEQLANKGNGTFEYIDNLAQLAKVFTYEQGKFFAVAKDVKIQAKFNPELIQSYRLIGYTNRLLATEDFDDDTKDAGELGADQNVTALYEIVPTERAVGTNRAAGTAFTLDFRYKPPAAIESQLLSLDLPYRIDDRGSEQLRFTAGVAAFGMHLIGSEHLNDFSLNQARVLVRDANLPDPHGFNGELLRLMEVAESLGRKLK